MTYVLLAAICSVMVSVFLKLARRFGIDIVQAVGWNYLAAFLLCGVLFRPSLTELSGAQTPWLALIGLAVALPSLFIVQAASVRSAGIVLTDVAQRLSLLLSLLAAFLFFGEQAGGQKIAGLVIGLVAVGGILVRPEKGGVGASGSVVGILLLTVWLGLALIDVMLKCVAAAGTSFAVSLWVSFGLAFVCMSVWVAGGVLRGGERITLKNFLAGLLLGGLNFFNILFYVQAHRVLHQQPAVVFASMNIGVVVLGTVVGALVFGERLSRLNWIAIVLAVGAIGLIATA